MAESIPPQRRQQLLAFVCGLGLDAAKLDRPQQDAVVASVDEALTHTSMGLARNHERLEFLGDAVLRLAASEFLQRELPHLPVGRHAALRAQLVSDRWLAELGERCGIDQVWRLGAMAAGDAAGRCTVLAETSEAVIGALYQAWGGALEPVHRWLTPHWQRSLQHYLADPDRDNWKSALQEWSQGLGLGLPAYTCSEISQAHGDPRRFHCRVAVGGRQGEGRGRSRREAQQQAARTLLGMIRSSSSAATG